MIRLVILVLVFLSVTEARASEQVLDTVHNLALSGSGALRSDSESDVCVFCHASHNMTDSNLQWNRVEGGGYLTYTSSTAQAVASDMGSSRLCLSCHDGTIALGDLMSGSPSNISSSDKLRGTFITGRARIGTDLRDDHPVSIVYDSRLAGEDLNLVSPGSIDLKLEGDRIQCISCHDAHNNRIQPFLKRTTQNGELCITCHQPSGNGWDWSVSSHAISTASSTNGEPWKERKPDWRGDTVAENSCMNCHTPHNAKTPERLVKEIEETTCFACHDGTMTEHDIRGEFQKFYRHPVDETPNLAHDAMVAEDPLTMPLHVECEDCHNSHASRPGSDMITVNPNQPADAGMARAPFVNGTILGVTGIDIGGRVKLESEYEYETCFKCHGVPGKNACGTRRCSTAARYNMIRQDGVYSLRDKFDSANPSLVSFHPVAENNADNGDGIPSLKLGLNLNKATSQIYCGDCHAGDRSPAAGGQGPSGPHGSIHEGLLAMNYEFSPQTPAASSPDTLCFKCHDSAVLFSDVSFPHREHVVEENTSCINCHDPHGSARYPHLLNFLLRADVGGKNWKITGAGGYTEPTWQDDGQHAGTCWMSCHGEVHDGESYPEGND